MHTFTILAGESSSGGGAAIFQLGIFLLIPLAAYFLMIRPQRRRLREQTALQSALEVGDEVLTTSGMYGFITGIDDSWVWVEIDEDVQVRVNRGAIQGKVDSAAAPTEPRPEPTTSATASPSVSDAPSDQRAIPPAGAQDEAATDAATRDNAG